MKIIEMLKDLCNGLYAMHSKNIAHRDIKLENVLFDGTTYKLCDFGSASDKILDDFKNKN